jgi:hypothetical protein
MSTLRGQLRILAQQLLLAADTLAGDNVFLPRDWPLNTDKTPAISLQTPRWRHADRTNGLGPPQFWSTVHLAVHCQISAPGGSTGAGTVEENLETLAEQVETTLGQLIVGPPQLFRRLAEVTAEESFDSTGELHVGATDLTFAFEYSTGMDAVITDKLKSINITADLKRPFDASGTYPPYAEPAFNAEVPPAPRTTGPDGRPEAIADIELPS